MNNPSAAHSLRIVLVGTTHPGNIGASARAMKTMGVGELALVTPRYFPHADATARASGADDLLTGATVHDDLDGALAGCSLVAGASARLRSVRWPVLDPRETAARAARDLASSPVALVFGREKTGLTNEELERCHFLVNIPSNPEYSSLNLAMAVQVLCYEMRLAILGAAAAVEAPVDETPPATADEMRRFYVHLEQVMLETGFLNPDNPRYLMRRLRRLFNRALPDRNEVNILRGVLSSVERWRKDGSNER